MNKKILVFTIIIALGLVLIPMPKLQAQTQTSNDKMEENITTKDLGVSDPGLLPTSPFYFFKNAFQGVRSALTFNPVKKAQLKMKYANQKILEAKELSKKKKNSELVSKSIEKYQKNIEDISQITKKAKKQIKKQDKEFVKKTLDQTLKQNRLLDNIEKNISKKVKERIRKAREKANQNNAQILSNSADEKTLGKQIRETIENQKGTNFKEFKDIGILKRIQNHSPDKIKDIIEESNNYTLSSFKEKLKNMPAEERKKFDEYIDSTGGDDITHFQLLKELGKESPKDIKEQVEKARKRVMKEIEHRIQNKENILESLQNGDMENLSTIQELEENIAPGLVEKVMNAKHQALNNFKKKMENAKSKEERKKILEQAKENVNVNKLQILNEIEGNVSEKDKGFVKQMIKEVNKEIENKINSAPLKNKDEMLKEIAGSSPEAMETTQRMISNPRLKGEMLQAQIKNLKSKIESSVNPEKIESLKEKLEQNNKIRQMIQEKAPEINRELEQKRQKYMNQINQEKAKKQLERANKQLSDLKEYFQKLQNQYPELENSLKQGPALSLMEKANNRLKEIKTKLENKKYGEAFGIATSAINITNNAYKTIKKFEAQTIMEQERVKERAKNIQQQGQEMLQNLINSGVVSKKEAQDIKEKLDQGKIKEIIEKYKDKLPKQVPSSSPPSQKGEGQGQDQKLDQTGKNLKGFNIESYLEQTGLSQESIEKIKENLENIPNNIKERIKQFPTDMLLEASESMQEGIQQPLQIDKDIERKQNMEQKKDMPEKKDSTPSVSPENSGPCAQVITPAVKDGVCKKFPTPCDVPKGWQKVDQCPPSLESQTPTQKRDRESEKDKEREKEQRQQYQEYKIDQTVKQTQKQKEIKKDIPSKPTPSSTTFDNKTDSEKEKKNLDELNENKEEDNIKPPASQSTEKGLKKNKPQSKKSPNTGSTGSLFKSIINFFK